MVLFHNLLIPFNGENTSDAYVLYFMQFYISDLPSARPRHLHVAQEAAVNFRREFLPFYVYKFLRQHIISAAV